MSESSRPAIELRGVAKHYALHRSARQALVEHLTGRPGGHGRMHRALDGVDLAVEKGSMIGVLGRNGSGKTTLLQLVAGILRPSAGTVAVDGSLGAILELGTGFNPQLTGRENIYIAGAARGLTRAQIDARLDDIVGFADIGVFIDEPVKVYSSGMFVRLAFAVATAAAPDVLLIDEALAVGDVFFRQKCYRRLADLRAAGTTVMLVSHAVKDVEELCDRAIVLERGRIVFDGNPVHAIREYVLLSQPIGRQQALDGDDGDLALAQGIGAARCLGHAVTDLAGRPTLAFRQGERARFEVTFEALRPLAVPVVGVALRNARAILVHGKDTVQRDLPVPDAVPAGGRVTARFEVALDLALGEYTVEYGLSSLPAEVWARRHEPTAGELGRHMTRLLYVHDRRVLQVGHAGDGGARRSRHHGLADLDGDADIAVAAGTPRAAEG